MASRKGQNPNPKKGKTLMKLINKSESESDESEHELSYYLNDRVKLMKEVLKIIKPKKIRSMAPTWMRSLETEEIHSMLFEELLGISNKRLKHVFNGEKQKVDEDSSSTDPEEEDKPIDVISLDDVTDDEFVINLDTDEDSEHKSKSSGKTKIKEESKRKKIKKEKRDHSSKKKKEPDKKDDEENLMSVLELLELQARARAIKSQLALESKRKAELKDITTKNYVRAEKSDNEDAIIIESPKNIEIIITSSESEQENSTKIPKNHERQRTVKDSDQYSTSRHEIVNKNSNHNRTEVTESTSNAEENDNSDENQRKNKELDKQLNDIIQKPSTSGIKKNSNIEKDDKNSSSEKISQSKDPSEISGANSEEPMITQNDEDSDKAHDKTKRKKIKIIRKRQSSLSDESQSKEINEEVISKEKTYDVEPGIIKQSPTYITTQKEVEGDKMHDKAERKKIRTIRKRQSSLSDESQSKEINEEIISKQNKTYDVEPSTSKQSTTETKIDTLEENDGILINVDQSEIEYISSD